MRALLLVLACLGACTPVPAPTTAAPSRTSTEPGIAPGRTAAPAAEPDSAAPQTTAPAAEPAPAEPAPADRCNPLPKVGDACSPGDGWCVESWGEPGGWSSALWCRGGRWEREQERNLPEDPP